MQTKTKSKITRRCNNGEEVYSPKEKHDDDDDDDRYYSRLLYIKEKKGEQDHKG
jgi:hypothetical protein